MIKNFYPSTIIALALIVLGICLKSGLDSLHEFRRTVTVKGLAEVEVPADHVIWPMQFNLEGNSLPQLYDQMEITRQKISKFLIDNGISESDISTSAPNVTDEYQNHYSNSRPDYRYTLSSIITVSSSDVQKVKSLIDRQGELLKEGIAIRSGDYATPIRYELNGFKDMKPQMMTEAIDNAKVTATQFALNSNSRLDKIIDADQGQFSIYDRDDNTPNIKRVRVVTTITYSLK